MGIIQNIKNKIITKTANKIADASRLSEKQLEEIEAKKRAYLLQKPDPNSKESRTNIERCLGALGVEIYHAYLSELNSIYRPVITIPDKYEKNKRIAFFDITKWELDIDDNYLDKLVNVYHVLSKDSCN